MNILLINHYAGSVLHGMEFRPYYMARHWIEKGHRVTIVAASHAHLRTQSPKLEGVRGEEEIDGVRYIWLKTPPYQGNGAKRVLNILAFVGRLQWLALQLAKELKPDVVIASSTYPLDMFPAARIAKHSGAKLIFEVHDLWPLSPIELGGISPWNPFMLLLQWAENYAYRKADRVVSMLPNAASHMIQHGMKAHKFAYVPNGVVVEEWTDKTQLPEEHLEILDRLKAKGDFLVGYAGAHGLANSLESFIKTTPLLQGMPVKLVLIGQGPDKERLQALAEKLGFGNAVFLPPVQKQAIPSLLSRMDALYIGFKKTPLYRFGVSPNKLMDYMMAAKPIINALEAGNDPVVESGGGISIPPEDPIALAEAIRRVFAMSETQRQELGDHARRFVLQQHDYAVISQNFAKVMSKGNDGKNSIMEWE
jgi:glycosyltransferase involved in cell wall biosynthesis